MDWIRVKDKLPEEGTYLTYSQDNVCATASFHKDREQTKRCWWVAGDGYSIDDVTHWMPLPKSPKK